MRNTAKKKFEFVSVKFVPGGTQQFHVDDMLGVLGSEGWQLNGVIGDYLIMQREVEEEKPVKTKSVATLMTDDTVRTFFEELPKGINLKSIVERFPTVDNETLKRELPKFYAYWTETNSKMKQRWQLEKVFDPYRRLAYWLSRNQSSGFQSSNPRGKGTIA